MSITLVITNAGRAALVAAGHDGTNAVRIVSCGVSPTAIVATAATAALPGEVKRIGTLSGEAVAADTIHMIVRDETTDAYTTRSIALYLADGTLFAAYGQAGVIVEKSAQALVLLALDVQFADIAATNITFGDANFLNPPSTTTVQGVVELATDAETIAGTDQQRAVTPKSLLAALTAKLASWGSDIWRSSNDGAGSGLDADLLDGQEGSWYSNIIARLGYTPANRAGDTFTGNAQSMAALRARGSVTFNNGTGLAILYSGGSGYLESFDWDAGAYRPLGISASTLTVNCSTSVNGALSISGPIARAGNTVWDAGNDGAGSGLDADLLDGQDGSFYSNISARLGYTPANRAGDTFTGPLAASAGLAITGGALTRAGNTVWDAGNDGAGSGLDADLLDGQDGSFYSNVIARLGYTPANRAGDTFTGSIQSALAMRARGSAAFSSGAGLATTYSGGSGYLESFDWDAVAYRPLVLSASALTINSAALVLGGLTISGSLTRAGNTVWDAGNDGAGSGLDADLLDGQDGSFYSNISARLGYTPANRAGDTFTGNAQTTGAFRARGFTAFTTGVGLATLYSGGSGYLESYDYDASAYRPLMVSASALTINSAASVNGTLSVSGSITRAGNAVWDAGNDGAGSGLDADLLDGFQAADFVKLADFAHLFTGAGYQKLPGGLILQWCQGSQDEPGGEAVQTVAFPISFPNLTLSVNVTTRIYFASAGADVFYQFASGSASAVTVQRQRTAGGSDVVTTAPVIFAIGY